MSKTSSLDEVKAISDKIAASSAQSFTFYKVGSRTLRDEKYKTIIYTPATMTEADKAEFTAEEKEQCLIVVWRDYGDHYTFFEVYSKYDNIRPFWNATFTSSENDYRVNKDLTFKFVKNEKSAAIVKSY